MPGAYLRNYGEINNGAHRKAADLVGAPAFIWHQAFWNSKQSEKERKERADIIQNYLHDLYNSIDSKADTYHVTPPISEIEILHDDRVRSLTISFFWQGLQTKIRVENHTEYLAITFIIDASVDISTGIGANKDELYQQYPLYRLTKINVEKFILGTFRPDSFENPTFDDLSNVHKFIYTDIWEEWAFPKILNVGKYLAVNKAKIGVKGFEVETEYSDLGVKFADFRGFITCEPYPSGKIAQQNESKNISELQLEKQKIQGPFYKFNEEQRGQWHRTSCPEEYWARYRLDSAWPFLSLAAGDPSVPLAGRTEFTVSRLLKGRMLYASALGPQPKSSPRQPVLFYIHSVSQCERQIGRVIDRLTQLGTLRLAAIIALPALKNVGQTLWDVESTIKTTRAKIHKLILNAGSWNKDQPERQSLEQDILGGLDRIEGTMAFVSEGTKIQDSDELGNASLEYRLIRSRYYKDMFFALIDSLRIERIEGYQPYDDFVQKRLQSAFGFIEGLERRVEEIRSEWRALDQLYLTTAVTILTAEIGRQEGETTKIQGQSAEIMKYTSQVQEDIRLLQVLGEFFLTVFLVPYYLIGLTMHVLNCEHQNWCSEPKIFNLLSLEQIASIIVLIGIAPFGIWRLLVGFKNKIRQNTK